MSQVLQPWRKQSLRTQILVFVVLVSVLIVALMGAALFYSTSAIITGEASDATAMAIDGGGHQLEMFVDQLKGITGILVENPQVRRYFGLPEPETGALSGDRDDIDALIASLLHANTNIVSIFLVGADGWIITNETDLDMSFTGSIQDQEWYKAALASDMPILTSARMQDFSMDKEGWVISLGREIMDDQNQPAGILRIDLKYQAIESVLRSLDLGANGYAFILNDDGQVVYHRDPTFFASEEKRQQLLHVLDMPDPELIKQGRLIHKYHLTNADWLLVGVASLDGVARMQRDIFVVLWILGSILFMVTLISISLFARRVTQPIRRLEQAMAEVEQSLSILDGKAGQDMPLISTDVAGSAEIESLSHHFQSMMERIRSLMAEIRRQEQVLRRSELDTLYSQVNPHFLYNTLDTIVWLAELGSIDRVIATCKAMARYFRLSLRGGSTTTTVRNELDHVRQYLLIQKERYQEKLSFEITADESLMDISMPRILLQPLVENAINHGIRRLPGNGLIQITAAAAGDADLLLSVHDNGPGFDRAVPVQRNDPERLGGIGLQNVAERVRLYYGDGYGLTIESEPGVGSTVSLRLKKNPANGWIIKNPAD